MALTDDDIREILRIVDESSLDELSLQTEGFSLHVRKGPARPADAGAAAGASIPSPGTAGGVGIEAPAPPPASAVPDAGSPAPPTPSPRRSPAQPPNQLRAIESPMLGTFYRAQSPGAPPFVEVGDTVEPDTVVAIIEVMKMMNSVPAGVSGTVAEVCAENAQLVEYGEPLFRVTP